MWKKRYAEVNKWKRQLLHDKREVLLERGVAHIYPLLFEQNGPQFLPVSSFEKAWNLDKCKVKHKIRIADTW